MKEVVEVDKNMFGKQQKSAKKPKQAEERQAGYGDKKTEGPNRPST